MAVGGEISASTAKPHARAYRPLHRRTRGPRRLPTTVYRPPLTRPSTPSALAVLRDPGRAEDVTQEVFLRLWRNPGRFDPARGALGPYLRLMARSRALDLWRSERSGERARSGRACFASARRRPTTSAPSRGRARGRAHDPRRRARGGSPPRRPRPSSCATSAASASPRSPTARACRSAPPRAGSGSGSRSCAARRPRRDRRGRSARPRSSMRRCPTSTSTRSTRARSRRRPRWPGMRSGRSRRLEVRLLAPLMAIRVLPALLSRRIAARVQPLGHPDRPLPAQRLRRARLAARRGVRRRGDRPLLEPCRQPAAADRPRPRSSPSSTSRATRRRRSTSRSSQPARARWCAPRPAWTAPTRGPLASSGATGA